MYSTWNKNFACACQLILTTLMQGCNFIKTESLAHLWSLLLQLELRNVEFWQLKTILWKPYIQIILYSVFLNKPIKYVQEKKENIFDCKRKRTFFYLNFCSIATSKNKDNDFLCQLCFLSLHLCWLTTCIFFLLIANTCHNYEVVRLKH